MGATDDDAEFEERALRSMLMLAGSIGGSRDVRGTRNVVDYMGVDPVAIRAAVLARDGHPMTPLPATPDDEVVVDECSGGRAVVRCPVWTIAGRSRWEMTIVSERRRGFMHSHVSRLVHLDGGDVLDALCAPCPARQGSGWADDADYEPEVWPGAPGETRIPRGAFVGRSYGVLFQQLLAGVQANLGSPPDLRMVNPGQAAIALLDFSFSAIYGDGLPTAYETMWQPNFESEIVDACKHIGAHAYAEVFRRIRDLLPADARGSREARCEYLLHGDDDPTWESLKNELSALDDSEPNIWELMIAYVRTHPEEFFLPDD